MTIKNNSEYTAENINFIFPKNRSVSDIDSRKIFKPNNHLKSYESIEIETHKTVRVHADKVQVFTYEGDMRVQTFSTQMQNPPEYLKQNI